MRSIYCTWFWAMIGWLWASQSALAAERPNIVFVLCDDLGYGDVHCLNPNGKIPTPRFDQLAAAGMTLTDAHSGSAVCSPTRYGLMTGRYAWRSRLQQGVLGGLSPRLIEPQRMTVADLLKSHSYHTACIGKWHLGMNWAVREGKQIAELSIETREQVWNVDFSQPIANGPNAVGFDEYFGVSASLDMVPYTFLQNDRVTVLPSVDREFPMIVGASKGMTRRGPAAPDFQVEDVLPTLTRKAVEYIGQRAADARQGRPFFLYLPLTAPHTPTAPAPEWQGRSGLNEYADFVMQTDASLGHVLDALDQHQLTENTLVIATSDNGCSPYAQFDELSAKGHHPGSMFRGAKADIYEGGHRVPFIVRWPAKIAPGTKSDRLVCLTDFLATCADILDCQLPDDAGEDSVSFLPVLVGADDPKPRTAVVHHSVNGSFAIRDGSWKLALCPGSGGWSFPRPGRDDDAALPRIQLYDLAADIGEQHNVQAEHPAKVARLTDLLTKYVSDGRSTPGAVQSNAVNVDLWKSGKPE